MLYSPDKQENARKTGKHTEAHCVRF